MRRDVSSESCVRQRIHLKHQAMFSSKNKSKKLKYCLLQSLFGALRVNWKPVKGSYANSADPHQMPHNVVSDQDLNCLLIRFSIKNRIYVTKET